VRQKLHSLLSGSVREPACPSWPGALCVPDECTGSERYFLRNGTEIAACAVGCRSAPERQLQQLGDFDNHTVWKSCGRVND
ncbi:hypothetical protein BOX15_Mlig012180g3, partial [Macrostomum lignano]